MTPKLTCLDNLSVKGCYIKTKRVHIANLFFKYSRDLFLRLIVGLTEETHERRLAMLRFQSLEDRRLRGEIKLGFLS